MNDQQRIEEIKFEEGVIQIRYSFSPFWDIYPPSYFAYARGFRRIDEFGNRATPKIKNPGYRPTIDLFYDSQKNCYLRFYLDTITNQPTWTNDDEGIRNALADIAEWLKDQEPVFPDFPEQNLSPLANDNLEGNARSNARVIVNTSGTYQTRLCKSYSIVFTGLNNTYLGAPVAAQVPYNSGGGDFDRTLPATFTLGTGGTAEIYYRDLT